MQTLRQIRANLGLNQSQVATKIGTSIPQYSLYESGQALPILEDMIILERNFGQKIDWEENLTPKQKHDIVQNIICLAENYPLSVVLTFAQKALKEGQKVNDPGVLIQTYVNASGVNDEPPLLSPDMR